MAINRVEITDFLVFKGEFKADFCPGINVLIGGNGTGKTTLMKAMYYSVMDFSLVSGPGGHYYDFPIDDLTFLVRTYPSKQEAQLIYIPTTEMLSHSESLLAFSKKYKLPFTQPEIDILVNAEQPETQILSPNAQRILGVITGIIGGEVRYENDVFYIVKSDGQKIKFSREASGFQRFGLLWKLLRNGLLEKDSILFWDEPENSLNPELIPKLVEILLELQRNGVQIFLATHSDTLASYIGALCNESDSIMFYSLYSENGVIKCDTNERFEYLRPNLLSDEIVNLYRAQLTRGMKNGKR